VVNSMTMSWMDVGEDEYSGEFDGSERMNEMSVRFVCSLYS
jgi:hypothetical protein